MNEFSNNGETPSIVFSMNYDNSESSSNEEDLFSATRINFYTYATRIKFALLFLLIFSKRKFFDSQTLEDIFMSKNGIEFVKSGNITESAYVFSNTASDIICSFFDSFNDESINFVGRNYRRLHQKLNRAIKIFKWAGVIKRSDYPGWIISGGCEISKK